MFITLEGPEGSGKNFSDPPSGGILKIRRVNLLSTREPGGTAIGDQVRSILMSMENQAMHRVQKFSCFAPPVPRLLNRSSGRTAQGRVVLCDRYADSTLAYQGYGHGLDLVFLRSLLDFTTGSLWPDLTILMDVDVELAFNANRASGW